LKYPLFKKLAVKNIFYSSLKFFDNNLLGCYHLIKFVIIGDKMVRTQIQLTEEQADALKKLALSRHLSIAELIRQAVDNISNQALLSIRKKEKRAIDGRQIPSGKRDIAREHDKYFAEAFSK
jgi:hypothetical protein